MTRYVEVALPIPLSHSLTYSITGAVPPPGTRVLVPFRSGLRVGWVLGETEAGGITGIRAVQDRLEEAPSLSLELLDLARWMADYYVAPLGLVLRAMLPSVLSEGGREVVRRVAGRGAGVEPGRGEGGAAGGDPSGLLHFLDEGGGERTLQQVIRNLGPKIRPELWRLMEAGVLEREALPPPLPPRRTRRVVELVQWIPDLAAREEAFRRTRRQGECYEQLERSAGRADLGELLQGGFSRSVVAALEGRGIVRIVEEDFEGDPFRDGPSREEPSPTPNADQAGVLKALLEGVHSPAPSPYLLHGVTGSGKTLVYIELLREVVTRQGKTAIVLVPEIALTPQTVGRFRAAFGEEVAVLHSALSEGERYDQWRRLRRGEKRIVVGARSALFAPVAQLGAIIVDEEHDGSYKQSEAPRYQARDLAVVRAARAGALCLLGSATPSLESWSNAERGKFHLLTLPSRVEGRPLPPVEVVDLRRKGRDGAGPYLEGGVLSPRLISAIRERLARKEQVILLLNRRGYSNFIQCRDCGSVGECPNCSVSLTLHRADGRVRCHHCRHEARIPDRCPECGSGELSFRGIGTQQVERVVWETFPEARIARMDVDTTGGKWSHHQILEQVRKEEVDLLLGTQMIAKGLDFPSVTLVGVVQADVGLHLPDFRSSERTFQLLSQVAGRAGRGTRGGEVILQSALPDHYAIQCALRHDMAGFAQREIRERASPTYPPHCRLANLILSSPDRGLVQRGAEAAAHWVSALLQGGEGEGIELVGPAPAPIERLHGRWRWHFFLRGEPVGAMTRLLHRIQEEMALPPGDLRLVIDRDPVALL